MKKFGLYIVLFVFLAMLGFFVFRNLPTHLNEENNETLACDIAIKECEFDFKGEKVRANLSPRPLQAMQESKLVIENLHNFDNLELVIYGLNMFMGETKPSLKKLNDGTWQANVIIAACTLDVMRFRAELLENQKPIGLHFDFELKK